MTVSVSVPDSSSPTAAVESPEVEKVRALLTDAQQKQCDALTIARFLRAVGGDVHQAAKRLAATIAWRQKHQPDQTICKACKATPGCHYLHVVGFCKQHRPIMYSCNALSPEKSYEHNRDHMVQTFEMAVRLMPPGVEQWVWLCDFHGFGVADINIKLARTFLSMSADHYPERLGLFIIVDAPTAFNMVWRAVQPFVDPKTHQKIRFLPYDTKAAKGSKLVSELQQHFDPSTLSWVLREMAQNRERDAARRKRYCLQQIKRCCDQGSLLAGGDVGREGHDQHHTEHDFRGHQQLLQLLQREPALLGQQVL